MNDRAKDVAQETLRNWGPIKKGVIDELSTSLSSKSLMPSSVKLSRALRSDFFLYGLLFYNLWDTGVTVAPDEDGALSQLETTPNEILLKLFPRDRTFPDHEPLDESKAICIRFITVTAASASYIAARNDSNSAAAYALSILRNLPLCLLPWTYPAAFNKALQAYHTRDTTFQRCIEEALRISYSDYATALFRNVPSHIRQFSQESGFGAVCLPDIKEAPSQTKLAVLIGEAIARLSLSSIFPITRRDWILLKALIAENIGDHGISKIEDKIEDMVKGFVEQNEALGNRLNLNEQAEIAIDRQKIKMCSKNIDGLNLNESSAAAIRKFYKSITPGELDIDNVETLLIETTPTLGFDSSAVYLLEPNTGRLVPRFKLTDYGNVVDKSVILTEAQMTQMVQTAIDSPAAIVRELRYGGRKVYSNIAERFGDEQIRGVLFVQGGENLGMPSDRLARFQAIRKALCDCLNVPHLNT